MMGPVYPVLVTPPAVELLSVAEAKVHLRVEDDDTADDAYIAGLILAARHWLDGYAGYLGRALISQTWEITLERFCERMPLPLGPVRSIDAITYLDADGAEQTVDAGCYELVREGQRRGYVRLRTGQTWPGDLYDTDRPVTVRWVAGFGESWNDVPEPVRLAVMMLVATWFENREAVLVGSAADVLPYSVRTLLAPFRMVGL